MILHLRHILPSRAYVLLEGDTGRRLPHYHLRPTNLRVREAVRAFSMVGLDAFDRLAAIWNLGHVQVRMLFEGEATFWDDDIEREAFGRVQDYLSHAPYPGVASGGSERL